MKVGLFNPYFQTMGGGERYFLTTAEFFLRRGDQVEIFWDGDTDIDKIKERFNLDLSGVTFVKNIFSAQGENKFHKFFLTAQYNLLFFMSDGSIPLSFAKQNIIHFQVPFNHENRRTFLNRIKLSRVNHIVCNSAFTKFYIDESYGVKSVVIYPPVDVESFSPGRKENSILSVGRFFGPSQPKKHEIMIRTFSQMIDRGLKGWRLVLLGGAKIGGLAEADRLRTIAPGYPIEIKTDSYFKTLRDYYSRAKIYWHASGYGENLAASPEKAEHFGITTVEAMASGAVPVVFQAGGQTEIIESGKNGFFWKQPEQLIEITMTLIKNPKRTKTISLAAMEHSKKFSKKFFFSSLAKLLEKDDN